MVITVVVELGDDTLFGGGSDHDVLKLASPRDIIGLFTFPIGRLLDLC